MCSLKHFKMCTQHLNIYTEIWRQTSKANEKKKRKRKRSGAKRFLKFFFGKKPKHSNSTWLVPGIHLQMHPCFAFLRGCYSLIRLFVRRHYPWCLRLHQAPVSDCTITEHIHLHYSALSVHACSSTSELCVSRFLKSAPLWWISDSDLLPLLFLSG